MIGSSEVPAFNPQVFDENFFADYEEQLTDISVEDQASAALANILTIEKNDGTQKSYEELRDEAKTFFSNDLVRNDEAIMNRMAMEFAQACMAHKHGAELAQDGQLGSVFEKGAKSLFGDNNDDDESDPKTGKKKKKRYSLFGVYI